jgi:hypothetical protein
MTPKHKVFLSFHSEDLAWKNKFETLFHNSAEVIVSRSVQENDIPENINIETLRQKIRNEYLRESTVTIVLIGPKTWQRKHVDWEISASLRDTQYNKRSGLIGIFLPTFPMQDNRYYPKNVPQRLIENVENGFAQLHKWQENPEQLKKLVHDAFLRKDRILPNNAREPYAKNRTTDTW